MKKITFLLLLTFVGITFVEAQGDYCMGVKNVKGNFTEDNKVRLSWVNEDVGPYWGDPDCDLVTHENAGYNNGWNISSLHSGLGTLGFAADKDNGYKVMDKFTCYEAFYLRFYLYEGATPFSTINGAYITIYDGDPLSGGNVIAGGDDENRFFRGGNANIYRVAENDFSDVSRPIFYVDVEILELAENYEEKTFWFVASFTGTLNSDAAQVHVVPQTILGETTTGEARIYSPTTGWQPMLDENTQTQQGIAVETLGYQDAGGVVLYADSCRVYRNGELISQFVPEDSDVTFIDEDAPNGTNIYGIQNVFYLWDECTSMVYNCDVRPSYSPKNTYFTKDENTEEIDPENPEDVGVWGITYNLHWDMEDEMEGENIKTFYNIYRKEASEDNFTLIMSIPKDNNNFEFSDITPVGSYEYKICTYNVYETGSSESQKVMFEDRGFLDIKEADINLNVYPNPTDRMLNIEMHDFSHAEITDLTGRIVGYYSNNIIDMSNLTKGIYFVKIFDTHNNHTIEKVVKK